MCSNKISQRNQSEHTHKGQVLKGTNQNTLTRVMYSKEPIRTHSQGSCTQRNQSEHTHKGHVLKGTNQNTLTRVMYSKEPIRTHTHKGHVLKGTNQNTLTKVMYSKEPIRTHSQRSCTHSNHSACIVVCEVEALANFATTHSQEQGTITDTLTLACRA